MGKSSRRPDETIFMEVTSEPSNQPMHASYDCDTNPSSSQCKPFIDTDPLSELVWSPMKGLCIKCADGTDSREKTYVKWLRGPSQSPFNTNPLGNHCPQETMRESMKDSTLEKVLRLQSNKKRKVKGEPGSSKLYIPSPLGKSNLTVKCDDVADESSKGNSIGDFKAAFPIDNIRKFGDLEPQESSKQTDISMIYETKKLNYCDSSSFRRHASFMMWVSNMFKDHETKNPKPLLGSSASSSFRPYHDDDKTVTTMMLLPAENEAERVKLSKDTTTSGSLEDSSSWIARFNPSQLVISTLPRALTPLDVVFEGIKNLQISRAQIMRCMQLQKPVSNLEGFFLRLRLTKRSVARYLVAVISGVTGTIGKETKVSIGVEVNGVRCRVECQYVSNQLIREDELLAWWSSTSQRGVEMPSEEELKVKLERKKLLGFLF